MATAYLGIDPTADSLHMGHLVGVMMLKHFQRSGNKPIALVGRRATGMIGDPSMKSQERKLLDETTLRHNQEAIKKQLARFPRLRFGRAQRRRACEQLRLDEELSFLDFIRDVGKLITVNYMMAKDSGEEAPVGREPAGYVVHRVQLSASAGLRLPSLSTVTRSASSRLAAQTNGAISPRVPN